MKKLDDIRVLVMAFSLGPRALRTNSIEIKPFSEFDLQHVLNKFRN